MNNQQDEWKLKAKENSDFIKGELSKLENSHWNMGSIDFRAFFLHVREIGEHFKTLKPLIREDREELWNRFQAIIDRIKIKQREEHDQLEHESKQKKEFILSLLRDALNTINAARNQDDLNQAGELLAKANAYFKTGWDMGGFVDKVVHNFTGNQGRLKQEDNQYCWDEYRSVSDKLYYKRKEISSNNYEHLKSQAWGFINHLCSDNARETINNIKSFNFTLKEAYINKDQRSEIRDIVNDAFERAQKILEDEWKERKQKREDWEKRMHENLDRWQDERDKNYDFVRKMENQIDDLRSKLYGDNSQSYIERVEGWIEDAQDKLYSAQSRVRELDEKISSVREKLRD